MASEFGKRLRSARLEAGFTQSELAKWVGLRQSSISEAEKNAKGSVHANKFAQVLGVSPLWLSDGIGPQHANAHKTGTDLHERSAVYLSKYSLPLFTWDDAAKWCESLERQTSSSATAPAPPVLDWLPAPLFGLSSKCFAVLMEGDSMDAPGGYKEGEIIYIDPGQGVAVGKDVFVRLKGRNAHTIKRLKQDDEGSYLLALNGNQIIRHRAGFQIHGVVVFVGRKILPA